MEVGTKAERFPVRLFSLYLLFYSGQAIFNTYLNLYLSSVGLSESQVGLTVSVSTAFILVAQMLWGIVSDRAKSKNRVLRLLYLAAAAVSLCFYAGTAYWYLIVLVTLFSVFFNPVVPLQDNYTLEALEDKGWDYGQVRMGGTIGYSVTVLLIGLFLKNEYQKIFWMVALSMTGCFFLFARLPQIKGYRTRKEKTSWRALVQNKQLLGLIAFNLMFSLGLNFYYSFYPIYFTSIGGNSFMVGAMMFACAVSEIPILLNIRRIVDRLGIRVTLLLAGACTTLRWLALYLLKNPVLIIGANLLHGVGYTSFSYCVITYIAKSVPKELRATGQTVNALVSSAVSRVLFGYLGGLACEAVGAGSVMLLSSLLMALSTVVFLAWSRNKQEFRGRKEACAE